MEMERPMQGCGPYFRRLNFSGDAYWLTLEDHAVTRIWAINMASYGISWGLRLDDRRRPEVGLIWGQLSRSAEFEIWRDPHGVRIKDMTVLEVPAGTARTMADALRLASSLMASEPGMAAASAAHREVTAQRIRPISGGACGFLGPRK
jgi:hypothetical protein